MGPAVTGKRLAVLGYHQIGDPPSLECNTWYYVPKDTLAAHLRYLGRSGWRTIDLSTFLSGLVEPDRLPDRAALITFDDGYLRTLTVALGCLVDFQCSGIVFVPTAYIGGTNRFDLGISPEEPICGWDDLRELDRHGVSVQSHGIFHRAFSQLDPVEQENEARGSKSLLEAQLQRPVECFAYPYGDAGRDPEAVSALLKRSGYGAACLYGGGPIDVPIGNAFAVERLAIGSNTDLATALAPSPEEKLR